MLSVRWATVATTVCSIAVLSAGCQSEREEADDAAPAAAALSEEEQAIRDELAKLPPDVRAAVEAQGICIVSDEPLGSMGPPIEAKIGDKTVYLCCKGCIAALESDPDTFERKLKRNQSGAPKSTDL